MESSVITQQPGAVCSQSLPSRLVFFCNVTSRKQYKTRGGGGSYNQTFRSVILGILTCLYLHVKKLWMRKIVWLNQGKGFRLGGNKYLKKQKRIKSCPLGIQSLELLLPFSSSSSNRGKPGNSWPTGAEGTLAVVVSPLLRILVSEREEEDELKDQTLYDPKPWRKFLYVCFPRPVIQVIRISPIFLLIFL